MGDYSTITSENNYRLARQHSAILTFSCTEIPSERINERAEELFLRTERFEFHVPENVYRKLEEFVLVVSNENLLVKLLRLFLEESYILWKKTREKEKDFGKRVSSE